MNDEEVRLVVVEFVAVGRELEARMSVTFSARRWTMTKKLFPSGWKLVSIRTHDGWEQGADETFATFDDALAAFMKSMDANA